MTGMARWLDQLLQPKSAKAPPPPTQREIQLGPQAVPYTLRRSRRRTIGLTVDHRGLTVAAPLRASLRDVESLIHRHGNWVLEKLQTYATRTEQDVITLTAGSQLPYLGGTLTLEAATGARAHWREAPQGPRLALPTDPQGLSRSALVRCIKERARAHFRTRLDAYAATLGLPPPPLALSSARTRWGSCSGRGSIRLNWRLLHFPPELVDYVVAHEVAHLLEMNHSPRFWAVVEGLYPHWREARAALRRLAPTCPVIE